LEVEALRRIVTPFKESYHMSHSCISSDVIQNLKRSQYLIGKTCCWRCWWG